MEGKRNRITNTRIQNHLNGRIHIRKVDACLINYLGSTQPEWTSYSVFYEPGVLEWADVACERERERDEKGESKKPDFSRKRNGREWENCSRKTKILGERSDGASVKS